MTREEKLAAYVKALRTVLEKVNQGHYPQFGVCGAVERELTSHPNYHTNLCGYEFCHANAQAWEKAFRLNSPVANGKQFASAFFIEGYYVGPEPLWKEPGKALRIEFMEWLIKRIEAGEAFVDVAEAHAAGWVKTLEEGESWHSDAAQQQHTHEPVADAELKIYQQRIDELRGFKLPCDINFVNGKVGKGCSLYTLQLRILNHGEALRQATRIAEKQRDTLLAALEKSTEFIHEIGYELHNRRATDWYPEGANNAANSMSEDMRLLGNNCIDFTIEGYAAIASVKEQA